MHRVGGPIKEESSLVNYRIDGSSNLEKEELATSVYRSRKQDKSWMTKNSYETWQEGSPPSPLSYYDIN